MMGLLGTFGKPLIKKQVKKQLEKGTEQFNEHGTIFTKLINIESVQKHLKLKSSLEQLKATEEELTKDLASDKTIDPIVSIISQHLSELKKFASKEEFKKNVLLNDSVLNFVKFSQSLIDISHYTKLSKLIVAAQSIEDHGLEKQLEIMKGLEDGILLRAIEEENSKLKVEEVKKNFEKTAVELLGKFNFKDKEWSTIVGIYNALTDKYLPVFNHIRMELTEHLSEFLDIELARVRRVCPHLAISFDQKDITPNFNKVVTHDDGDGKSELATTTASLDQLETTSKKPKTKKVGNF